MTAQTDRGRACHPKTNSPQNKIVYFQFSKVSEWTVCISRPLQLLLAKVAGSKLSLKALLVGHACGAEGKVRPCENLTINRTSSTSQGANNTFFMFFGKQHSVNTIKSIDFWQHRSVSSFLNSLIFKICIFTCKTLYDSNENYIRYTIYSTAVGKSPKKTNILYILTFKKI